MGSDNYKNLKTLLREQATEKWLWNEIGWNTSLWGPEPVIPDCTWPELDDWRKTECGCSKCWQSFCACKTCLKNRYYNKFAEPIDETCYKVKAFEYDLRRQARRRFAPSINDKEFKPATDEQFTKWVSWLTSPGMEAAWERGIEEDKAIKNRFANVKFEPIEMERLLANRIPRKERDYHVLTNPKWVAFRLYGNEQTELAKKYLSSLHITTSEDYEKANKAYGALVSHVNSHGQIIENMPEKTHKSPAKKITKHIMDESDDAE